MGNYFEEIGKEFVSYFGHKTPSRVQIPTRLENDVVDTVAIIYSSVAKKVCACKVKDIKVRNFNGQTITILSKGSRDGSTANRYDLFQGEFRNHESVRFYIGGIEKFKEDYPYSQIEALENQSNMQYEEFHDYILVKYMRLYIQYPYLELLLKSGFENIIYDVIRKDYILIHDGYHLFSYFESVFKEGKDIQTITGMKNFQWHYLVEKINDCLDWKGIKSILDDHNVELPLLKELVSLGEDDRFSGEKYKVIHEIMKQEFHGKPIYSDLGNLIHYIKRCVKEQYLDAYKASVLLRDYNDMSITLDEEPIYKPEDLKREHDVLSVRYEVIKDEREAELLREGFIEQYNRLQVLNYEDDRLIVVVPKDAKDLYKEGKENHNCVASYAQRHATQKTNIVFIRQKKKPDESYITVEIDHSFKHTPQIYYAYNKHVTNPKDKEFISDWLRHVQEVL